MQSIELFLAFFVSFGTAVFLQLTHRIHGRWTGDFQGSGVQKHHHGNPSRIGLLPLLAGSLVALFLLQRSSAKGAADAATLFGLLLLCTAPAAGFGLLEDVTKSVRARWRLLGPMLGTAMGAALMGAVIPRAGIPGVDALVAWWPLAFTLTVLMLVGFTHAMNIVDGLNGLACGLAVLMLLATTYAAHLVGDASLFQICAVLCVATLGFMVVNFPRGLMFLGDGGAYFLGFILAQIWVMLLARNAAYISPWFVMAVAFHPTMETIFSILRRKFRKRQRSATAPDRLHLHSLIYRRRMRPLLQSRFPNQPWASNAAAAVVVLFWASLPVLAACLFPASSLWNLAVWAVAALNFWLLFRSLVTFRPYFGQRSPLRRKRAEPVSGAPSIFDAGKV